MLAEVERVGLADIDITTVPTAERSALRAAKLRANEHARTLRALLFPEDDDG